MESSLYCCQVRRAGKHEHYRKLLPLHGIVQLTDDAVTEQPTCCCHMCKACFQPKCGRRLSSTSPSGGRRSGWPNFQACFRSIWETWAGILYPWRLPWHSWYVGCPAGHADALTQLSSCAAVSEHWCALCAAQGQLHMRSDTCFAQTGKLGLWDLAFAVTIDAGLVIAMFGNHVPHLPAAVTALGAASMQQLAAGPPFRKAARVRWGSCH